MTLDYTTASARKPLGALTSEDYGYAYPDGLDLHPASEQHSELLNHVMERAQASRSLVAEREGVWDNIDNKLQAYIPIDEAEAAVKAKDPRRPVSIVIPVLYAVRETIMTYLIAAFFGERPIFTYDPQEPLDALSVALLEFDIEWQMRRSNGERALTEFLQDAVTYGYGIVSPHWKRKMGWRTRTDVPSELMALAGAQPRKVQEESVIFEGHDLKTINPRQYLPDTNTPIHRVEDAEFVGWVERTHAMELLDREAAGDAGFFNCRYVQHLDGRSILSHQYDKPSSTVDEIPDVTTPVDLVWMYARIIPRAWGVGDSEYPETWLFCVAGDRVIVKARRVKFDHNDFPVAVAAPETDGRTVTPVSRMEIAYGLQEVIDFLLNTHMTNVRKSINDMFVYDPSLINSEDIANPEAGKLIRARRAAMGRDLRQSVFQLPVANITQGHVADADYALNLVERVTGATAIVQGMMREGGERRSATEARGARASALSRLERIAKTISNQAMGRLGYMMAVQTQQFRTQRTAGKILGRYADQVRQILGDYVTVNPHEIEAPFDVVVRDGTIPNPDNVDTWMQLFQVISANPMLAQRYDIDRIFQQIARLSGVKNLQDFTLVNASPVVMPNEEVDAQAAAGNLVPMSEAGNVPA